MKNDIVLYPTDTLYGLGVDATNPEAVLRLKELKGREEGKHISIVVSDVDMMREYAEVTSLALKLIEAFLPGKLTIILKPKNLPDALGTSAEEIGIRIPNHPVPLQLVKELGRPITATSANVSGLIPEKTVQKILEQFAEKASWITKVIDEGELPPSDASTVVDARGDVPIIVREGALSTSEIQKVANQ